MFELSGGLLVPSLLLAAGILVLLGMGMPTTGVYIMGVALLAPVLIGKFQLPVMPVHMFLLFYSCLSAITPPVAVAAFAVSAIAGANPFKLAPYACKLAVGGFVLPFFFLFNTGILMQGSLAAIIADTLAGAALVFCAALFLHGYVGQKRMPVLAQFAFGAAGVTLIVPNPLLQISAALAAAALFAVLHRAMRASALVQRPV
jgi:TRAP-type uncharacterized transport system fused permease subunit